MRDAGVDPEGVRPIQGQTGSYGSSRTRMVAKIGKLLALSIYRRIFALVTLLYLVLVLFALGDLSVGGAGFDFLHVPWDRMFERTGVFTFEPIAQLTVPGATLLLSPVNLVLVGLLAVLAGLNLTLTVAAFREPRACRLRSSGGLLAAVPALFAGGACCAPTVLLVFGIQASSLLIGFIQILIPVALLLLVLTLKLAVDRTDVAALRG